MTAVYWRYLRSGGLPLLAFFLTLSLGLQTAKVYLDFLLRDLVQDDNPNLVQFFQLFGSLSAGVIGLTYLYNILGQVDMLGKTYWTKNLLIAHYFALYSTAVGWSECQTRTARQDGRKPLPGTINNTINNAIQYGTLYLLQCPVELFEAQPVGRILNRLSCDLFVIGIFASGI